MLITIIIVNILLMSMKTKLPLKTIKMMVTKSQSMMMLTMVKSMMMMMTMIESMMG